MEKQTLPFPKPVVAEMLAEEERNMKAWLAEGKENLVPQKLTAVKLVRRAFVMHEPLLSLLGGWEREVKTTALPDSVMSDPGAAEGVYRAWMKAHPEAAHTCVVCLIATPRTYNDYRSVATMPAILGSRLILPEYRSGNGGLLGGIRPGESTLLQYGGATTGGSNRVPVRVGQRIAAPLLRLIEKAAPAQLAAWQELLKEVGDKVWANKEKEVSVKVSCRPSHMLRLGSYGDSASCFRAGGPRGSARLYLSADIPNSFMLLLKRGAPVKSAPYARSFGVVVPKRFALVTNFYGLSETALRPVLLPMLGDMFGLGADAVHAGDASDLFYCLDGDNIYTNGDSALYLPANTKKADIKAQCEQLFAYSAGCGLFCRGGYGPYRGARLRVRPDPYLYDDHTEAASAWMVPPPVPSLWNCRYNLWQLTHMELANQRLEQVKATKASAEKDEEEIKKLAAEMDFTLGLPEAAK